MLLAGCATPRTAIPTSADACASFTRSPRYSGKKLEAVAGKPFRQWVVTTNLTLDRLKCPK